METPMKISFGFSKVQKKRNILPQQALVVKDKVEYISSFDKNTIKLSEKEKEYFIPVKNDYSLNKRISDKRKEAEANFENVSSSNVQGDKLTVEQLAIRELTSEAKEVYDSSIDASTMAISANQNFGESSETANYDEVPVSEFGLAMLRGMGWVPGKGIGKKQKVVDIHIPELRARGLGLGADAPVKD